VNPIPEKHYEMQVNTVMHHRKRLHTSNPIERSVQQELKRRTAKVRVFPNEASLMRFVSAILVEIDEK